MAALTIRSAAVRGIAASAPDNFQALDASLSLFSKEDIDKIKQMTGINQRPVAPVGLCASDLMTDAARDLLTRLKWDPASVELLVVVTQSGDYILPATSCTIQERLKLKTSCLAFDMGLGCSGYVYAMSVVGSLISSGSIKRALLLAGDTSSRMPSPNDRATALLFGDVGTATAIEFCDSSAEATSWSFVGGTDGRGYQNLIIPAGGCRYPLVKQMNDGAQESKSPYLFMDGGEIFKFTIEVVPDLLRSTLDLARVPLSDVDYFVMHQANAFLLNHLAKKMKIPAEKIPQTLRDYGNTSSGSIPLTMVKAFADGGRRDLNVLIAGFGVGYSWGAMHLQIDQNTEYSFRLFELAKT